MGDWSERWSEGWVDVQRWMGRWRGGRKEEHILFNDTLNTSYLWLYGVRHMVKDHSDSEKGNPLPPHGLLFPERCGWIGRWRGGWEKRMGR